MDTTREIWFGEERVSSNLNFMTTQCPMPEYKETTPVIFTSTKPIRRYSPVGHY